MIRLTKYFLIITVFYSLLTIAVLFLVLERTMYVSWTAARVFIYYTENSNNLWMLEKYLPFLRKANTNREANSCSLDSLKQYSKPRSVEVYLYTRG